jgi:hypothetical protein
MQRRKRKRSKSLEMHVPFLRQTERSASGGEAWIALIFSSSSVVWSEGGWRKKRRRRERKRSKSKGICVSPFDTDREICVRGQGIRDVHRFFPLPPLCVQ